MTSNDEYSKNGKRLLQSLTKELGMTKEVTQI